MLDITNPVFHNEDKARAFLEAQRWPDGIVSCPFCLKPDEVAKLNGKSMGKGWYYCNACDQQKFTVRTGSIMERSHVPLAKWAMAFRLFAASKKGISSKQLQRLLGVSYKTAWFIGHRIREAMAGAVGGPVGGDEIIVEADDAYIGGSARNVHRGKPIPHKKPVVALVERYGRVTAKHVPDVTGKNVRKAFEKVSRESMLMTDGAPNYEILGPEFYAHAVVAHSKGEYTDETRFAHTNTIESFFSILKRGITGSFHSVSEQHLQRYVDEFAFRWNNRERLGVDDKERASRLVKAGVGKRLTYRRPDEGANLGGTET